MAENLDFLSSSQLAKPKVHLYINLKSIGFMNIIKGMFQKASF